ncbi:corticosteroid 11-beta-dehydrogenase isozyme 2 [Pelobates cultripes]|uniref:Corticosteroid 11-beta-dehydrogenase isozyme 2 n=1 Tax=Pelobates cultripes TaxID=61616 RepID=A0AAD1TDB4_PELCU|nr:corticosteroid 11-beta-dehydrogenase isozyme 2 [Pelobates cultripes]
MENPWEANPATGAGGSSGYQASACCDSGFGKATAETLHSMGFKVIASVLNLESPGAKDLQKSCSKRMTLIQMDLTKTEDIQKAQQIIRMQTADTGLWALVNNAGYCAHFGDAELTLESTYRACMEVNFFGTVEITKALLPLIRYAKGRIVTVSSPADEGRVVQAKGDISFPYLAAYGASKAALTRVMDLFRHELFPWGVKVCIIQPGAYKTGAHYNPSYWERQNQQLLTRLPTELLQEYGEEYITDTVNQFLEYGKTACTDISPVTNSILDAVLSENPKVKYYVGKGIWLLYLIFMYVPENITSQIVRSLFSKRKCAPRSLRKQMNNSGQD